MYRLLLSTDYQPNVGYQNRNLDEATFERIASGEWVEGDGEAQARLSIETVYYAGVWNPDAMCYVNDLAQDQIADAYASYAREVYP
jgi:hypothetical protein